MPEGDERLARAGGRFHARWLIPGRPACARPQVPPVPADLHPDGV